MGYGQRGDIRPLPRRKKAVENLRRKDAAFSMRKFWRRQIFTAPGSFMRRGELKSGGAKSARPEHGVCQMAPKSFPRLKTHRAGVGKQANMQRAQMKSAACRPGQLLRQAGAMGGSLLGIKHLSVSPPADFSQKRRAAMSRGAIKMRGPGA